MLDVKNELNGSRANWNTRWFRKSDAALGPPDDWLQRFQYMLPKGSVLDVACGTGRNAVYLAERGFEVTAVDISEVALGRLAREAQQRGLSIATVQHDLEQNPVLPEGQFDVVLNYLYLHRPLLPAEMAAVRPGGVFVMRTFSRMSGAEESQRQEITLQPCELQNIFADWRTLYYEEGAYTSTKHGSLAGIIAERPKRERV